MAQDTTPAIVVYQGDGSNTTFSVPFDKGYYGEVKVLFVRRGLSDYTYEPNTYTVNGRLYAWVNNGTYVYTHTPNPAVGAHTYDSTDVEQANDVSAIAGQTITVDGVIYARAAQHDIANQLLLTWTGTMLEVGDYICIARETERGQPYTLPNNQKHIETALDNLERQIQEVAKKADNALLVDPAWMDVADGGAEDTSKMDPINWLKSIISVRAVRYANGWLDYSLDDPNVADGDKTWTHLLNTDNIKAIRERSDIVDGVTIYWTEYQASDGTWRTLANTSYWESRIQYAVDTAEDAKDVADDAKDIAQDAKDIVDTFDGRLIQAEQDASDAKDIAQDASDAVSAHITDTNNPHSVTAAQAGALPNTTKYGAALSLTINSTTYVVTAQLKDQDGNNLGTAQTIDLPLESVVVSGAYDSVTKEVVLTLQDGSKIRFSVADLVSGLQTEITALNMLSADLVDDTSTTHKFVTTTEKSTWNGKQDAISDLATIRSGAAAGATAVQPGDLATVARSGSYNDLLNKPTIPTTLAALTGDVSISTPTDGQHLVYDANAGVWKNTTSAASVSWGGITGILSDQTDLKNALDAKANTDMDNLTDTGKNISNWSSNVTNCITNVPQDIKIDFTNGVITLKAGSKVYIPNGFEQDGTTLKFDVETITSDIVFVWDDGTSTTIDRAFIFYSQQETNPSLRPGQLLCPYNSNDITAGSSATTNMWYDTTTNKIKVKYNGSYVECGVSFPICTYTRSSTQITSVDQIFNGIGTLGTTRYVLPGVKGLIGNGLNDDGTYKNLSITVSDVLTFNDTSYGRRWCGFMFIYREINLISF